MMTLALTRNEVNVTAHCRLDDAITKIMYIHVITFSLDTKMVVYTRAVVSNAETTEKEVISGEIDKLLSTPLPPIATWIIRGLNGVPPLNAKELSTV